jgi:hypothetical protein
MLAQPEQQAALAIKVLQPEFQTAAMHQWALAQIHQGYSLVQVQMVALQSQQDYMQHQLAIMAQNSQTQNVLLIKMSEALTAHIQQSERQIELIRHDQAVLSARLVENDTDREKRLKNLEDEPRSVTNVHNHTSVTVGDNFRGVINAEASSDKQQSGWGGFIVALAIALVILGMLSGRRFMVMGDGSVLVQDNCARVEKSGQDYICRDK